MFIHPPYHYAEFCCEAGIHILAEKPFKNDWCWQILPTPAPGAHYFIVQTLPAAAGVNFDCLFPFLTLLQALTNQGFRLAAAWFAR
jgi:hypothetical protein